MGLNIGIMGKHPGFGDFVRAGISAETATRIEQWLDPMLHALRSELGNGWEAFWDHAQTLRFWIGRAVAGRTLAGIFVPSRDSVGRRYPLILLAEGADLPPPVDAGAVQTPYEAFEAHLAQVVPGTGAASLLAGLDVQIAVESDTMAAAGPVVWAHHPDADLTALLASAAGVDRDRATTVRSYWWAPGDPGKQSAVWLGQPGLPGSGAFAWALAGIAGQSPDVADAKGAAHVQQ
jgi:type VI secretion system protein ImpM